MFWVSSSPVLEKDDALMMDVVWCQRNRSSENMNFPHSESYAVGLPTQQTDGTFHPLFLS